VVSISVADNETGNCDALRIEVHSKTTFLKQHYFYLFQNNCDTPFYHTQFTKAAASI